MKFFVQAFALSLIVTGAIASTQVNPSNSAGIQAKVSGIPVPTCPPNDPNACNIWNPPPVVTPATIQ